MAEVFLDSWDSRNDRCAVILYVFPYTSFKGKDFISDTEL